MTPTQKLVADYLARENATTALNYRHSLQDFARSTRSGDDIQVAFDKLLTRDGVSANEIITRWKRSMVGTRDKAGKLVGGRGLAPATVNLRLAVLRGLVRRARRAGIITWELEVAGLPSERVHDVRGPGMVALKIILETAKNDTAPAGARNYAILRVFAETGLRRRELAGLEIEDFEIGDSPSLWILAKGRRQKERVGISVTCAGAIEDWLAVRPKCTAKNLFTNLIPGRYRGISPTAVYDLIVVLGKKAGVRKVRGKNRVHPHALRHTVFTEAGREVNRSGRGVETLMKFTRHKDARVAQGYLDATDDAASSIGRAVAAALDLN
jgi:integrase/recombinase XerC